MWPHRKPDLGVVLKDGGIVYPKSNRQRHFRKTLRIMPFALKVIAYVATTVFAGVGFALVMMGDAHELSTTMWMLAFIFMFALWTVEKWR